MSNNDSQGYQPTNQQAVQQVPPQYQESTIHRTEKPIGQPLDVERATVAIPAKSIVEETEMMNFNGYNAKFRRVPAFAFAKARQHLRRVMRDNRPEPPVAQQGLSLIHI